MPGRGGERCMGVVRRAGKDIKHGFTEARRLQPRTFLREGQSGKLG